MLQYKTICLPLSQKKGIKAKEYYRSLISIENVTKACAYYAEQNRFRLQNR